MSVAPEEISEAAILAKQEELASAARRGVDLAQFALEQDEASRPDDSELSEQARASRELFASDAAAFHERSRTEFEGFAEKPAELFRPSLDAGAGHLHVFGPDGDGSGGPLDYRLQWSHLGEPFLSSAYADFSKGTFGAYDYTTGGPASWTVAQVGFLMKPALPSCRLSIRPYVKLSGYSHLKHRVFDASLGEQRWAFALGSIGIAVQSRNEAGGGFHTDAEIWQDQWSRHEPNPSGTIEHYGTGSSVGGYQAEIFASGSRWYTIWITCRVCVVAEKGFAVTTYATSVINCSAPFCVVEEIPL